MKLVGYVRVSTTEQVEHGHGLDVQRMTIRQWANENGHRITAWAADEGLSGSNGLDARVGLLEALAAVQAREVGGLVVYRLDRLARDLVLQESLLAEVWRAGGRVFSTSPAEDAYLDPDGADADPSRALIRQILGAVGQYERAMIRLRLKSGKARKAEQGGFLGGTPAFGVRAEDGALVPDEEEQRAVALIVELRSSGASLRDICTALEAQNLRPKRSHSWHPQTVARVLRRAGAT